MIKTTRALRNYAEKLYMESEHFSTQEKVGTRIKELLEHAHPVESVLLELKSDLLAAKIVDASERVQVLEAAIKKIEGAKKA